MDQTKTRLGELDCRVLQADRNAPVDQIVVLCHGFGAPADDLVPIGAELIQAGASAKTRFVFPAAPISLAPMGYGPGRAWWELDMERLGLAQTNPAKAAAALRLEQPAGLAPARRMLMSLVEALMQQTRLPLSKIVLGGFSQGAMLATDVALRLDEAPAGLCIFSGALINEVDWAKRVSSRRGLRVLQSHGRQDPLLPFENAEALRDLLRGGGLDVTFMPFDGPHTISIEAIEALAARLR